MGLIRSILDGWWARLHPKSPEQLLKEKQEQDEYQEKARKYRAQEFVRRKELWVEKRKAAYEAYMQSDVWKAVRERVLKRDKYKCKYCGAPAIQVHHEKYTNFRRENIKNLKSICISCHQQKHSDKYEIDEPVGIPFSIETAPIHTPQKTNIDPNNQPNPERNMESPDNGGASVNGLVKTVACRSILLIRRDYEDAIGSARHAKAAKDKKKLAFFMDQIRLLSEEMEQAIKNL